MSDKIYVCYELGQLCKIKVVSTALRKIRKMSYMNNFETSWGGGSVRQMNIHVT